MGICGGAPPGGWDRPIGTAGDDESRRLPPPVEAGGGGAGSAPGAVAGGGASADSLTAGVSSLTGCSIPEAQSARTVARARELDRGRPARRGGRVVTHGM